MTRRNKWLGISGTVVLAAVVIAALFSLQPEITPIDPPETIQFSAASIARGKTLAALGDCSACHTRAGGEPNSGGLAMDTPSVLSIPATLPRMRITELAAGLIRRFCVPCATV